MSCHSKDHFSAVRSQLLCLFNFALLSFRLQSRKCFLSTVTQKCCLHLPRDAVRGGVWLPTHGNYDNNDILICNNTQNTHESGFCTEQCDEFSNAHYSSYPDQSRHVSSLYRCFSYTVVLQTGTSIEYAHIFHLMFSSNEIYICANKDTHTAASAQWHD